MFDLQLPLTRKLWTTLSNPCNKVRGKYFYKEVFLRRLLLRLSLSLRLYHCVRLLFIASVCIQHIYVYFCMNQQMTIQQMNLVQSHSILISNISTIMGMALNYNWWGGSISTAFGIVKYSFIATPPVVVVLLHNKLVKYTADVQCSFHVKSRSVKRVGKHSLLIGVIDSHGTSGQSGITTLIGWFRSVTKTVLESEISLSVCEKCSPWAAAYFILLIDSLFSWTGDGIRIPNN